uniref:Nephrocystin 3-like N-terminal domain-containing protein n=1 Tax=Mycena chlorophos TaxID=658473 RepID=A0ABQ0LXF2_MYCCL|nr:predicted protein [Mycena chlorophos]
MDGKTVNIGPIYGGQGGTGGAGGQSGGAGGVGQGNTLHINGESVKIVNFHEDTENEYQTKIRNKISPLNVFPQQQALTMTRVSDTGEWLLESIEFQEWKSSPGAVLWCYGNLGVGKTMLVSFLVDYLRIEEDQSVAPVACLYLDHRQEETQKLPSLLAALWRQFIFRKEASAKAKKIYEEHSRIGTQVSKAQIFDLLQEAIAPFSKVYVMIDGLNEFPINSRQTLINDLQSLGPSINLLITAQPQVEALDWNGPLIYLEIQASPVDINNYIKAWIQVSDNLRKQSMAEQDSQLENKICIAITNEAQEM